MAHFSVMLLDAFLFYFFKVLHLDRKKLNWIKAVSFSLKLDQIKL